MSAGVYIWQPSPRHDPERPSAPLCPAPGREHDAHAAERALATLLALTGDERMESEVRRALIRAGVVRVERSE